MPPGELPLLPQGHHRRVRRSSSTTCAPAAATHEVPPHGIARPRSASSIPADRRAGVGRRPSRRAPSRSWLAAAERPPSEAERLMDRSPTRPKIITTRFGPRRRPHARPLRAPPAATRRCARPSTMAPDRGGRRGQGRQPARPRRRRLPGRRQVGLLPARRVAPLPRGQRRRVASPAPTRTASSWSAIPTSSSRACCIACYAIGAAQAFLYVRGEMALAQERIAAGAQRRLRRRLHRPATSSAPTSPSTSSCTGAPAPTSSARRPPSSRASRATGACPGSSRRSSRRPRASTCSPPSSTTSRRCRTSRGSSPTAAPPSPRSAPRASRAPACSRCPATSSNPGVFEVEFGVTTFRDLIYAPATAAASATATRSRPSSPAAPRRRGSSRSTSTCRSRRAPSTRPARCSARAPSS